jgi:aspartate racemase
MLDADCPVYGLQAPGLDGREALLDRIEDLAIRCIQEVIAVQPDGPYRLAGYSAGGLIAYEMAIQMHRAGRQVEFLGILDCCAPGYPVLLPLRERLRRHWGRFRTLSSAGKLHYLLDRLRTRIRRLAELFGSVASTLPSAVVDLVPQRVRQCNQLLLKAMIRYRPSGYAGDIVIFRAGQAPDWLGSDLDDPALGWGQWVQGRINCHEVPGTHLGMLDNLNVPVLAEAIRRCLLSEQADEHGDVLDHSEPCGSC